METLIDLPLEQLIDLLQLLAVHRDCVGLGQCGHGVFSCRWRRIFI
jgi:hypothetical protein